MNTTSLLVDILIIGIQVSIWIAGLIFSILIPYRQFIHLMEKLPASTLFIMVACFYTFGLIFDYIIANIFKHFKTKEEKEAYQDGLVINILVFDQKIHQFLDSQYARLRIARATLINIPLITLSLSLFILNNSVNLVFQPSLSISILIVFGIIMTILAYMGWNERNKTYWNYIKATLGKMEEKKEKNRKK